MNRLYAQLLGSRAVAFYKYALTLGLPPLLRAGDNPRALPLRKSLAIFSFYMGGPLIDGMSYHVSRWTNTSEWDLMGT